MLHFLIYALSHSCRLHWRTNRKKPRIIKKMNEYLIVSFEFHSVASHSLRIRIWGFFRDWGPSQFIWIVSYPTGSSAPRFGQRSPKRATSSQKKKLLKASKIPPSMHGPPVEPQRQFSFIHNSTLLVSNSLLIAAK